MPKNIVICCDGTGNEFGDSNSNVVKLYQALARDPSRQVAYYHPGVGTMGAKNALTVPGKLWTSFRGLAFGYGLSENIADAYRFLMLNFQAGDQVYVFGFSRGAYTARALCGLLEMFGLLAPGNEGQIPYALRLYKRHDGKISRLRGRPNKFLIAARFKHTFSIDCKPHFLGLWDTVSSIGWILDPIGLKPGTLPNTADPKDVAVIRHAVSLDERRAFFRQNLFHEEPGRDIQQVWFAGVHSDVGGSYPESESGLSKITLRWMLRESKAAGLLIDDAAAARILGASPAFVPPLAAAMLHNSLTIGWWLGEIWPKSTKKRVSAPGDVPEKYRRTIRLNLFRRRYVVDGALIHESVFVRKQLLPSYKPSNVPRTYKTVREPLPDVYPHHLQPGEKFSIGIHSRAKWNDTTLLLSKGEKYRLEAGGKWYDATIPTGPAGYSSPSLFFRLFEWQRRAPRANWFALIGSIEQRKPATFLIGDAKDLDVPEDGILYCFANDLPAMYGNNSGYVELTATRIA